MRLLNTTTLTLEEFVPNKIPPYAILSHTWGGNEVVFEDFQLLTAESKSAWKTKVEKCCQQALRDGLYYAWIDTCCIDKSSSAELSEAINSMYSWYEKAQVCYAFLEDVSADVNPSSPGSPFQRSRWFTRGFTLQELIAPAEVVFFSNDWVEIGRKSTMYKTLCRITLIDEDILLHQRPVSSASIARRMAWAAHRHTTRPEDIAYCLMGLFSVNMPMLYGEGEKAFLRLQEEIMKQSDDQSIFTWTDPAASPDSLHGLLAPSPAMFAGCANIFPYQDWEPRQPYAMTNRGLQIELPLRQTEDNLYIAALNCPTPPDYENNSFLAIFLRRLSVVDAQYARVKVGVLAEVHESSKPQTIYVRQVHLTPEIKGIFPIHALEIRTVPDKSIYRVVTIIDGQRLPIGPPPLISFREVKSTNASPLFRKTFFLQKEGPSLAALVILARKDNEGGLIVALGSGTSSDVCFDAFDATHKETLGIANVPDFQERIQSSGGHHPGTWVELKSDRICVNVAPQVYNGAKYYVVDIQANPVPKSRTESMADSLHGKPLATPDAAFHLGDRGKEKSLDSRKPDAGNGKPKKSKFSFWK